MAQPDFYQLEIDSENVKYTCYLNGFPVYSGADESFSTMTLPVQLYLIGKDNKLMVEAEAIDKSKQGRIVAFIETYQKGDIVNTGNPKESEITLDMEVKELTKNAITFDNERFDFSKTLIEGEKLKDKEVRAYANILWKHVEKGDSKGFVSEMERKITDYAAAHDYTADEMREGLTQQLRVSFFSKRHPALKDDQISIHRYSDGRIYEIKIDGEEFLKQKDNEGFMQMPVFVSKMNGKIGIIR